MKFISCKHRQKFGVDMIELRPPRLGFVQDTPASCLESSDSFISTRKQICIFTEALQKSGMNINSIPLLAPEKLHDYKLPEASS
jgi:hypothetical protein